MEALDKQLRIKISDKNCEWRFDESFIIFKFVKTKSQILVSSLYAKMCVRILLHVIKNATMWNVESESFYVPQFLSLIFILKSDYDA